MALLKSLKVLREISLYGKNQSGGTFGKETIARICN